MKRTITRSFLLLALASLLFASCKKDYDVPPIQDLPVGTVYTLSDLFAMESGTVFTDDASVYGTITADEVSGNLYKAAFMQDPETGDAVDLYLNAPSGVRIGDKVRIYLKGVTYALYNGLPQLSGFEADGHIVILENDQPIEPKVTTIAEIVGGQIKPGQLVKLENVMFTEQTTFAEPNTYGNRTLVDPSDLSKSVIVRTSNYANFANDSLPQGTGNMIAIASLYNTTWQLLIRSANELEFDGYNPPSGGTQTLPYYQSFSSSFGSYTTYDVAGSQSWVIDYNTAKMTGYENSTNYPNEDWLISAPVSFEGVSSVTMTMTYIARYFDNVQDDITVHVSTDYESGNPNLATWTRIPATWVLGSNWTDFVSTPVDLSRYAGQTVHVAIKYLSSEVKAGTIEVQSIVIQEGGAPTPPPGPGETQYLPYDQSFTSDFGTYAPYDVFGAQSWMIDYSTAKMTGYENSTNYANEDWLISSPVSLEGVSEVSLSMTYIARYFSDLNNDITIQVSSNYESGDPNMASWTPVPATWVSGSNWNDFATTDVDLSQFAGQVVHVAVKYLSTDVKAGTIEVKRILIKEGGAPTPPPGPTPGGSGTAEDPYNVGSGIQLQNQDVVAWVQGYIVGSVVNGASTVTSPSDIDWSAPFTSATNVVIADDPNETNIGNCLFVNLPAGKPLRTEVNLLDHPDNLGKRLAVNGKLRTYFAQAGLRDSNGSNDSFVLEGFTPPDPSDYIFSESFENGQGNFTIQDVVLPEDLTYVWIHDTQYNCMRSSAFVDHSFATESWLVSPAIDLSNATNATLSFEQAVNKLSPEGVLHVLISNDYQGDVTAASWSELVLDQWPAGNNWTFVSSTANLSQFTGNVVTIAFKYTSTSNGSAVWEVKNLVVE